jgi:hypothetical protein
MGFDGIEFSMPIWVWHSSWPKTSNDNGLLFLRNSQIQKFNNVSWHSNRHFPQFHSQRYLVMQAICNDNLEQLERCLKSGWNSTDDTVDYAGLHNAVTLACHLDRLEALHLMDMYGANLSKGAGKFNTTPLMVALAKWNVRIIDYLMERGVDPSVEDSFGFTATKKAEMRQLKTIQSMLKEYEEKPRKPVGVVTNSEW